MTRACAYCGSPAAVECRYCRRPACSRHERGGACVACLDALCSVCGYRLSVGYCQSCGRLVCTQCSVQLDNVRRLCVKCSAAGRRPGAEPGRLRGAARLALQVLSLAARG